MKTNDSFFLIITGPTGVGKTALVHKLVQKLNFKAEIINADIGQFYEFLSIGTAKHDTRQEQVPHHLFNKFSQPINYTAYQYRQEVLGLVEKITQAGNLPIVVGGSGFYIKSLFFPPKLSELRNSNFSSVLGEKFIFDLEKYTNNQLWDKLSKLDPVRAQQIHPNDRYRLARALFLMSQSDKKASSYKPEFNCPGRCGIIFLSRERQELYNIINDRVEHMFKEGWIDEVINLKNLPGNWFEFLRQKKVIGYSEIINFITAPNEMNLEELKSNISQKTRAYAKRQLTFWRSFKEQLFDNDFERKCIKFCYELNLTLLDLDLYIDLIANNCIESQKAS